MPDDIKFLAWHSVGADDYKSAIKQIIKRGFLLPASMRSGKTCKIQIEDYLAGDAPFVFMHVQGFNAIHQENEFMSGYHERNFYFDAVELLEAGAILRRTDLLYDYKTAMQKIVNKFLGSSFGREQAMYFLEYAAYMSGVDVKCRDNWSFHEYRILAEEFVAGFNRLQDEGRVGKMFDKVYKECLKIRSQNEYTGDSAINMLDNLYNTTLPGRPGSELNNAELIWEGPLPLYLALNDSPAFRAVE